MEKMYTFWNNRN